MSKPEKAVRKGIVTLDLEEFIPPDSDIVRFDLADFLYKGLIIKEKEYRQALKEHPWQDYSRKWVLLACSADAIIPIWAYMLAASYLENEAEGLMFEENNKIYDFIISDKIATLNMDPYRDQRVVG